MTVKEVLDYFGTQAKVAEVLGISQASVSQWGDNVPKLRQFELERLTEGELKVD